MRTIALIALLALPMLAQAQNSPVGRWKTIDDDAGKVKSVVEIQQSRDGSYAERVVEILDTRTGRIPPATSARAASRTSRSRA